LAVLLGESLLATSLSFGELAQFGRLNRICRRLHHAAWRAIWRTRSKTCGGAELGSMLRLAIKKGKAAHVRELVWPMAEHGDACVLLQALNDEPSYLFIAVKNEEEHVEVVRALLEVGGRELAMMTRNDGTRGLMISAEKGHLDVVNALLEAGGRELAMLTADSWSQLPLHECAGWASGGGECAPGGRGARAGDDDSGRWNQLPLHECAGWAPDGQPSATEKEALWPANSAVFGPL
jgi:hypothetical protein